MNNFLIKYKKKSTQKLILNSKTSHERPHSTDPHPYGNRTRTECYFKTLTRIETDTGTIIDKKDL